MLANSFGAFLEKKGLKYTAVRRSIYEKVSRLSRHFDADELYEILKKEKSNIARGSVYRTIPLLLESGVIQKSVGNGKGEFFERSSSKGHHDHIICVGCGKVIEYHNGAIEELQMQVCKKYNAELLFHDHKLFVRCASCRR
ncbi:MAG: transcriptional repressor [Chlamydiae bacterium]|nr:transcriptional repressor [Chlamydiota bacterium]MBI3266817.1 transcriptional repressor [Chlamydiota bacterium]